MCSYTLTRLPVVLVTVVLVSGLLPPGEVFGSSPARAQTTELCDTSSVTQFTDVEAADYAAAYVLCMRTLGLSKGAGDGTEYRPDRNLNRGQMASFLVRLWRDTLKKDCPSGQTPFTDTPAGGTHTAAIDCLYNLGIAKGTSTTTYGPAEPLKASHISRFLLRTYLRAGATCPTAAAGEGELSRAVDCLQALRVIPTTNEGRSPDPVNRAQMAIYVIGLWHNLAGRGLPPTPPERPMMVGGISKFATDDGTLSVFHHSCGLRPEGTVTCWGGRNFDRAPRPPEGRFAAVSVGNSFSCGLRIDGTITCWPYNYNGVTPAPEGRFSAVSAGYRHMCGLQTNGTVTCWGDPEHYNEYGQADAPRGQFVAVSAGVLFSCAVRADTTVICWGDNEYGQLYPPADKFATVSAGHSHACGLRTDGTVVCWGDNYSGQLDSPDDKFIAVSAGGGFSCGVRIGGTVVCWGNDQSSLVSLAPRGLFITIAAGMHHACGLRTDGTVDCWGHGREARSPGGLFALPSAEGPVLVDNPRPVNPIRIPTDVRTSATLETTLSVGRNHMCGLRSNGTVVCWGKESRREYWSPHAVRGQRFSAISAGEAHSCGLRTDGTVVCWGNNRDGQLDVPLDVPGGRFVAVSAGPYGSCGLWNDGTISCWGVNDQSVVHAPKGKFVAVSVGQQDACAIQQTDGALTCWGTRYASPGRDGRGGVLDVPDGSFIAVSAGSGYSCGLRVDKTVTCWGGRHRVGHSEPRRFITGDQIAVPSGEFTTVSAGSGYACGVRPDGTVTCWDANGIYSSGITFHKFITVSVAPTEDVGCGLMSDGHAGCWGRTFDSNNDWTPWEYWESGPWDYEAGAFALPGVLGGPGPPVDVTARIVKSGGNRELVVSWAPPVVDGGSAVTGYRVEYSQSYPHESSTVRMRPADATGDVLGGVEPFVDYYVMVAAVNEYGVGQGVVKDIPGWGWGIRVPDVPSDVEVEVRKSGARGTVAVSWGSPVSDGGEPVTGYVVTYSYSGDSLERTLPADARTDSVIEFGPSTAAYEVSVAAENVKGVGGAEVKVARWCPSGNKYELSSETKRGKGATLFGKMSRIRALETFGAGEDVVNEGEFGGWVDSYENLSQDGCSWIFDDAEVWGDAKVSGNGVVYGNAQVYGNAKVKDAIEDNSVPAYGLYRPVYGPVYGPQISGHAKVFDSAQIVGNARVYGNSKVFGGSVVSEDASVYGSAEVLDNGEVSGSAQVYGGAKVYDFGDVSGMARVYDSARVFDWSEVYGSARVSGRSKVEGRADVRGSAVITDDMHLMAGIYDGESEHVRAVVAIASAVYASMKECPAYNESTAASDAAQFVWVKVLGKSGQYDDSVYVACSYYIFYRDILKALTPTGWQVFLQYVTAFKGISTSTSLLRFYNSLSDILDLYSALESANTIKELGSLLNSVGDGDHKKLIEGFSKIPENLPCQTSTRLAEHLQGTRECY